jgi:hypothetical protein
VVAATGTSFTFVGAPAPPARYTLVDSFASRQVSLAGLRNPVTDGERILAAYAVLNPDKLE